MTRSYTGALAVALGILLVLACTTAAEQVVKHSGIIVAVDERAGTFVLAEVGPWQVRDGDTLMTYRTIALTPETAFAIVFRDEEAPSGYRDDFVETPLEPWAVYVDDHVTVDCRHEGARLVAVKITVTDLPGGALTEAQ